MLIYLYTVSVVAELYYQHRFIDVDLSVYIVSGCRTVLSAVWLLEAVLSAVWLLEAASTISPMVVRFVRGNEEIGALIFINSFHVSESEKCRIF